MKFYRWLVCLGVGFLVIHFIGCSKMKDVEMVKLEEQIEQNRKLGIRAVEFPDGLDWFNTPRALKMKELKGKVVLLDFWTFCCINCMHVLPELARLEKKYPKELVVVGVHSAKFDNEKESKNIRNSILRYEITHPVVNDPELVLWNSYGVHAWPTLVLIDPEGRVVMSVSGEGHYELFNRAVGYLSKRDQSNGETSQAPINITERSKEPETPLLFPGKILANADGLVVSDSNHHQILILDFLGNATEVIGSGISGSKDGDFSDSEFNRPQGVFRQRDLIYVADTENHLIREIDLERKTVKTIAGTGAQGNFIFGRSDALKTPLNSPWDVIKIGDLLYIAMAGAHQIWTLNLKREELDVFVGSGREDIVDAVGPEAALAQPSGLSFDGREHLYFADSEVSAIRRVNLKSKKVETLIGKGLFEFGDQDGLFDRARLQHPLGVFCSENVVFVADTYNDKIKVINLETKKIATIAGSGQETLLDGAPGALYEPGGLSAFGGKLYISDTNNHAVRILDLSSKQLSTLQISRPEADISNDLLPEKPKPNPFLQEIEGEAQTISKNGEVSLFVDLPSDHEFTENVPLQYEIKAEERQKEKTLKTGELKEPGKNLPIKFKIPSTKEPKIDLIFDLNIAYCSLVPPKLCKFKLMKVKQPFVISNDAKTSAELHYKVQIR